MLDAQGRRDEFYTGPDKRVAALHVTICALHVAVAHANDDSSALGVTESDQ
jgi:hypothetical protein